MESKETISTTIIPSSNCNAASMTCDVVFSNPHTFTKRYDTPETGIPSSSLKLTAPLFTKKANSQSAKVDMEIPEIKQTLAVDAIGKLKKPQEQDSAGEVIKDQVESHHPCNSFSKLSSKKEQEKAEVGQLQSHRPLNPFLKSSIK